MPFVSMAAQVYAQQTARGLKEDRIFPRRGAGFGDVAAEGGGRLGGGTMAGGWAGFSEQELRRLQGHRKGNPGEERRQQRR